MNKATMGRLALIAVVAFMLFVSYFLLPKAGDTSLINLDAMENSQPVQISPIPRDTVYILVEVDYDPDSVLVIPVLKFNRPVLDTTQTTKTINNK
jgi:hypothetical protein